ncbi:MAG: GTPase Era [Proteobacteria bacterium]|nr:GTPase Era [Pseudomonadota bacterium]
MTDKRCGYVALVGAPNAGKSTLMNRLMGTKVSIVTHKVQTTRARIIGVSVHDTTQIIFVDTPGIFAPKRRLERAMVAAAWGGAADADVIVLLVDASERSLDHALHVVAGLKKAGRKAVLALNKVDLVPREALLSITEQLNATGVFTDTFMISALTGDGVDDLIPHFAALLPKGPWLYPEDHLTDMNERLFASEITREKLFLRLHQELPYALTVETEGWEERPDGSVKIDQVIYVERTSQRSIVLGKGGQQIKAIGAAARTEMEALMERRVHLFLFVKVRDKWRDDPERYREMGLDFTD